MVHENRGLNPYIEDVARRVAKAGFMALAPDELTSVGGYPGNDADGRDLMTPHIAGVMEIHHGRVSALRDFYDTACYQQVPTGPDPLHALP